MVRRKRKKDKMAMKRYLLGVALVVTIFIFLTIMLIGNILNEGRQEYLDSEMQKIQNNFIEMQTFDLLAESYGRDMACLSFQSKLKKMDQTIWELGEKIQEYRSASQEFAEDPYYKQMKETFNENEVYYYLLLKNMVERCNISKEIILYFYKNEEECDKCDDQSFVLSDINQEDHEDGHQELAIFSFDMDLNVTTVKLLDKHYDINEYPCVVINQTPMCGMYGEKIIKDRICESSPGLEICKERD